MKRAEAGAPAIWKVKLIDNDPFRPLCYMVEEKNLSGGGEIIEENGMPTAVGIGGENSLVFDDVMVPEDGDMSPCSVYRWSNKVFPPGKRK